MVLLLLAEILTKHQRVYSRKYGISHQGKKKIVNDLISSHISSTKHKIERGYLKRGERSKTGARLGVLMKSMSL